MGLEKQEFAQGGSVVVDDTSGQVDGDFCALQVIESAVISAIDSPRLDQSNAALTGRTLDAGLIIPIQFKSLTLSAGSVIAVNAVL